MVAEVGGSPSLSFEGCRESNKNMYFLNRASHSRGLYGLCPCVVSCLCFASSWSSYTAEWAELGLPTSFPIWVRGDLPRFGGWAGTQ